MHACMHTHIYIYIYIFIYRERDICMYYTHTSTRQTPNYLADLDMGFMECSKPSLARRWWRQLRVVVSQHPRLHVPQPRITHGLPTELIICVTVHWHPGGRVGGQPLLPSIGQRANCLVPLAAVMFLGTVSTGGCCAPVPLLPWIAVGIHPGCFPPGPGMGGRRRIGS